MRPDGLVFNPFEAREGGESTRKIDHVWLVRSFCGNSFQLYPWSRCESPSQCRANCQRRITLCEAPRSCVQTSFMPLLEGEHRAVEFQPQSKEDIMKDQSNVAEERYVSV
jgi:hypothetical protein